MESSVTALNAEIVGLTRLLMMPCSWMVCRVVILMTPVVFSPGDMMGGDPLFGCKEAARNAEPDHEGIEAFELLLRAFFAAIAVILLVHAVELHEGLVVIADGAAQFAFQPFGQCAAEGVAGLLDPFDGR